MIFYNKEKDQCIVSCNCGCGDGVHFFIDSTDEDTYLYQLLLDTKWNAEQNGFFWKIKKIWSIIRGKDYSYSEICMSKEEWLEFKEWINSH